MRKRGRDEELNKLMSYVVGLIIAIVAIAVGIAIKWGPIMLLRVVLSVLFVGFTGVLLFFAALTLYASSWKYFLPIAGMTIVSGFGAYFSIRWVHRWWILWIILFFIAVFGFGIWYMSEPDVSLSDRFRSASKLEEMGHYKAAARKYEKAGNYDKAAEMYIKLGWLESAAWAYEKAGNYEKAAELYEKLYESEKDTYYLKEAHEYWKKAGKMDRAALALERYAEEEPWFWEDVAKLYEEIGKVEKATESWKKALEYYLKEAEEEGVFWEDVGNIARKLGREELAREAYEKFLDYCVKEAEKDPMWWRHVAEAYEYLGEKEKAKDAMSKYEEYRRRIEKNTKEHNTNE